MGENSYPRLINKTINVINTFAMTSKSKNERKVNHQIESSRKVAFAEAMDFKYVMYYNCREKDHFSRTCP